MKVENQLKKSVNSGFRPLSSVFLSSLLIIALMAWNPCAAQNNLRTSSADDILLFPFLITHDAYAPVPDKMLVTDLNGTTLLGKVLVKNFGGKQPYIWAFPRKDSWYRVHFFFGEKNISQMNVHITEDMLPGSIYTMGNADSEMKVESQGVSIFEQAKTSAKSLQSDKGERVYVIHDVFGRPIENAELSFEELPEKRFYTDAKGIVVVTVPLDQASTVTGYHLRLSKNGYFPVEQEEESMQVEFFGEDQPVWQSVCLYKEEYKVASENALVLNLFSTPIKLGKSIGQVSSPNSIQCVTPVNVGQGTGQIRVGQGCGSSCTCSGTSINYNFDEYLARVIYKEWAATSWYAQTNIANAFKAGSVAARTNAMIKLANPTSSTYHLPNSTCWQAMETGVVSSLNSSAYNACVSAVSATNGYYLQYGGSTGFTNVKAEYAAENNNSSGGCGNGKFQMSVQGNTSLGGCFPLGTTDQASINKTMFGHGRGMSQRGSFRWATGKDVNSSNVPGATMSIAIKNWQRILGHYYPYFILNSCSTSTIASLGCGSYPCTIGSYTNVACGSGSLSGTTVGGAFSNTYYRGYESKYEWGREKVYRFLGKTGQMTFALSNMSVDLDLILMKGTTSSTSIPNPLTGGVPVAFGNASINYTVSAADNNKYFWLVVDGFRGAEGAFTLTYASPCAVAQERIFNDEGKESGYDFYAYSISGGITCSISDAGEYQYVVYTLDGRVVCSGNVSGQEFTCETPSNGLYIITLTNTSTGERITKKALSIE